MREHPIPQDVVGYRFHIVGNMTIKQFAELGAGCIVGFLLYSTNLFTFIKWPLIAISVGAGALAAFVPFEERPLDHWFVTFIRVLYKPTQFYWRRDNKIPDVFLHQTQVQQTTESEFDLSPARRARIQEYLRSLENKPQVDVLEADQAQKIGDIMGFFQTVQVGRVDRIQMPHRPTLTIRPRSLKEWNDGLPEATVEPTAAVYVPAMPPAPPTPEPAFLTAKPELTVNQVGSEIKIPETGIITLQVDPNAPMANDGTLATSSDSTQSFSTAVAAPDLDFSQQQPAAFNADLPFPAKPTEPNKLVGMVLSPQNELVNDAIIEIKTTDGNVARAVKTNALGQFFITTPLASGSYFVQAEKDGYAFAPQQLTLSGKPVDPIEIRSLS